MKIAIYDGECGLCRNFAAALRKFLSPREIDVVPCGSAIQKKLAPMVAESECLKAFILVDDDGRILKGAEAASAAVVLAPALARFRWMIDSPPGRMAAKGLYAGLRRLRRRPGDCGRC